MGRTSKKIQATNIEESEVNKDQESAAPTVHEPEPESPAPQIPSYVEKLMRLYPQYDEFWVTPYGCVHPKSMPSYCLKGATLYKNKYFTNNKQ